MKEYILRMGNMAALFKYMDFLTECEFEGEILLESERMDAKDILYICDKLINQMLLRVSEGDEGKIERYLCDNGLLCNK